MTVKIRQRLLEEWQGRKDSNPRPSVLETDALTRLSYAPTAERKFYPTPNGVRTKGRPRDSVIQVVQLLGAAE
jgi:hypothetical protein